MKEIIRYFMENCIRNLFDAKLELYKDSTDLAGFILNIQEEVIINKTLYTSKIETDKDGCKIQIAQRRWDCGMQCGRSCMSCAFKPDEHTSYGMEQA